MNFTNNWEIISEKFSHRDLIIFLIPFVIFSAYLFVFNPGILSFDSFNQLHQIATNEFNNWHPFFHTFIEMLCLKVYSNPMSIAFFQIFIFSFMWMIICNYFRRDNNVNNYLFLIQIVFTFIISLIPINGIFSILLIKELL